MRRLLTLVTVVALTACGGGGGGGGTNVPGPAPSPTATPPGSGPSSKYVTPTFTITIPSGAGSSSSSSTRPNFVSAGALSVSIALTSDSAGIAVGSLSPNPAVTNVNGGGSQPNCNSGCTISGPPSPPGTDAYTITLYTLANAGGTQLDVASQSFTITEGSSNAESMTLEGIPAALSFTALPTSWSAGIAQGGGAGLTVSITAQDALGNTITGTYANAVTLTDPDTNGDGTRLVAASCPGTYPTGNTAISATTATFTSSSSTATFCYGGLAESPVTLTATASGATSGTRSFSPTLNVPTSGTTNSTPSGLWSSTDLQLEAAGQDGTIAWTESGWTNTPYNQTLLVDSAASTCNPGGPLSTFATVTPSFSSNTTVFTVTSASPYTPGKCTVPVYDGVTGTNAYTPPTFSTSYTSSGFTVDAHQRK